MEPETIEQREDMFYELIDRLEELHLPDELPNTYFPYVKELEDSIGNRSIFDFFPIILYYSTDPFRGIVKEPEYQKLVSYCIKKSEIIFDAILSGKIILSKDK